MPHELAGQPVEQFAVRRTPAIEPQVVRRLDDPGAKMIMPHAIDHHAGKQRILFGCDPVRQCLASVFVRSVGRQAKVGIDAGKRLHSARRNHFARGLWIAAIQPMQDKRNLRLDRKHARRTRMNSIVDRGDIG